MKTTPQPPDDWQPVPPGSLVRCARTWRARQQRRVVASTVSTLALVLAVAGTAWWSVGTTPVARITCDECHVRANLYVQNSLNRQETREVAAHLEHCPLCEQYVSELKAASADAEPLRPVAETPLFAAR